MAILTLLLSAITTFAGKLRHVLKKLLLDLVMLFM